MTPALPTALSATVVMVADTAHLNARFLIRSMVTTPAGSSYRQSLHARARVWQDARAKI
jgi:hypothetical protein